MVFTAVTAADDTHLAKSHELYGQCKQVIRFADGAQLSHLESSDLQYCGGYMMGFTRGITLTGEFALAPEQGVSTEALVRSFMNYLNTHPAEMDTDDPANH